MIRLWGLVGAILIGYHVAEHRRDVATAELEARLRRARARLHAVLSAAKRIRGERDSARAAHQADMDFVRDIEKHGHTILTVDHVAYLRSERDRAAQADVEKLRLRGALELIADGCEVPQRIAVEALSREEDVSCAMN
jgi:hypothetical protein